MSADDTPAYDFAAGVEHEVQGRRYRLTVDNYYPLHASRPWCALLRIIGDTGRSIDVARHECATRAEAEAAARTLQTWLLSGLIT